MNKNSNKFLEPFQRSIWIAIGILAITFILYLQLTFIIETHKNVHLKIIQENSSGQNIEYSWTQSILMVYGILFQQGFAINPKLASSRIALLAMLIFSSLLYQFYSSIIVGTLLKRPVKSLRTIRQLLNSDIECGLDEIVYNRDIYENVVGNVIAKKLYYKKIASKNNYLNLWDGVMRVKKGGFAFNTDYSSGYMIVKGYLI